MSNPLLSGSLARNPASDKLLQWYIIPIFNTNPAMPSSTNIKYAILSVSSGQYLDGRNPGMSDPVLSDGTRNPATDTFLQFAIAKLGSSSECSILSVSSGQYLDGRDAGTTNPLLSDGNRIPATDKYLQFEIKNLSIAQETFTQSAAIPADSTLTGGTPACPTLFSALDRGIPRRMHTCSGVSFPYFYCET